MALFEQSVSGELEGCDFNVSPEQKNKVRERVQNWLARAGFTDHYQIFYQITIHNNRWYLEPEDEDAEPDPLYLHFERETTRLLAVLPGLKKIILVCWYPLCNDMYGGYGNDYLLCAKHADIYESEVLINWKKKDYEQVHKASLSTALIQSEPRIHSNVLLTIEEQATERFKHAMLVLIGLLEGVRRRSLLACNKRTIEVEQSVKNYLKEWVFIYKTTLLRYSYYRDRIEFLFLQGPATKRKTKKSRIKRDMLQDWITKCEDAGCYRPGNEIIGLCMIHRDAQDWKALASSFILNYAGVDSWGFMTQEHIDKVKGFLLTMNLSRYPIDESLAVSLGKDGQLRARLSRETWFICPNFNRVGCQQFYNNQTSVRKCTACRTISKNVRKYSVAMLYFTKANRYHAMYFSRPLADYSPINFRFQLSRDICKSSVSAIDLDNFIVLDSELDMISKEDAIAKQSGYMIVLSLDCKFMKMKASQHHSMASINKMTFWMTNRLLTMERGLRINLLNIAPPVYHSDILLGSEIPVNIHKSHKHYIYMIKNNKLNKIYVGQKQTQSLKGHGDVIASTSHDILHKDKTTARRILPIMFVKGKTAKKDLKKRVKLLNSFSSVFAVLDSYDKYDAFDAEAFCQLACFMYMTLGYELGREQIVNEKLASIKFLTDYWLEEVNRILWNRHQYTAHIVDQDGEIFDTSNWVPIFLQVPKNTDNDQVILSSTQTDKEEED